jgi:hypothetical protein
MLALARRSWLALRMLAGLRRSLARKLDPLNSNQMSQVFYAPAERGQEDTATSEAEPTGGSKVQDPPYIPCMLAGLRRSLASPAPAGGAARRAPRP